MKLKNKFRAFNKKTGMIYDERIEISLNGNITARGDLFQLGLNNVEDLILMKFIGILDVNGVDVFEDDVIQDKHDKTCKHIVKWFDEECCFGVYFIGLNGLLIPSARITKSWVQEFDKIVIGNIHENKELKFLKERFLQ